MPSAPAPLTPCRKPLRLIPDVECPCPQPHGQQVVRIGCLSECSFVMCRPLHTGSQIRLDLMAPACARRRIYITGTAGIYPCSKQTSRQKPVSHVARVNGGCLRQACTLRFLARACCSTVCLNYGSAFFHGSIVAGPPSSRPDPKSGCPTGDNVWYRWCDGLYDWQQP